MEDGMSHRRMMSADAIHAAFRAILAEWASEDEAEVSLVVRSPATARLIGAMMPLAEIICMDDT